MATPQKTASGTWRIQIEVKGRRVAETLPTRREVVEWAARKKAQLLDAHSSGIVGGKTVADALGRYAKEVSPTKKGERWELVRLHALPAQSCFPAQVYLADLRPQHLALWRDARLKQVSRGSVLRDMVLLSHVFEVARRDWGWLSVNPIKDVRKPSEPDHREVLISLAQQRKMLRALGWSRGPVRSVSHAVANCFLAALQTGMRAGELCGLCWDDVRDDYCILHTGKTKTGKARNVPLTPTARRTLELMRGYDDDLVFGLKSQTLDAMFRKYRGKAGLSGFTFHDARHTAATRLAQRLHVLELCKVFGWTSTSRALTYFNASASDIAKRITGAAPTPQSH